MSRARVMPHPESLFDPEVVKDSRSGKIDIVVRAGIEIGLDGVDGEVSSHGKHLRPHHTIGTGFTLERVRCRIMPDSQPSMRGRIVGDTPWIAARP